MVICSWLILNEPVSMVSIMFVSAFDSGTQVCAADLKRCVAPPKVYLPLSDPDVPLALNICLSRVITGDYRGVVSTPGGHTQVTRGPESSLRDQWSGNAVPVKGCTSGPGSAFRSRASMSQALLDRYRSYVLSYYRTHGVKTLSHVPVVFRHAALWGRKYSACVYASGHVKLTLT